MSCSELDLKAYFLDELPVAERQQVRDHLRICAHCGDELEALATTRAVLLSVPEEEPPRRIAFLSDRVFEPKWWERLWRSGPQLGFASASVLALAIAFHGLVAPRPAQPLNPQPVAAVNDAAIQKAVAAAVAEAVQASDARHKAALEHVVDERLRQVERRHDEELSYLRIAYQERMERERQANTVKIRNAFYEAGVFEQ